MTRVFLADTHPLARAALRLLLRDLNMQVVGEAAAWPTVLTEVPAMDPDMLVVDWNVIPNGSSTALADLRAICPAVVIVLISPLAARQQAALSAGADTFISKSETPDRVAERLRSAAARVRVGQDLDRHIP
jgi:DNA-binding NarL/FixJ family response regulator